MKGLIVVAVPKCGTNFLSRYLASITGWSHRWGRPSRDLSTLQCEIPAEPDAYVLQRAVHLVLTDRDLLNIPEDQRPTVFGGRKLVAVHRPAEDQKVVAEVAQMLKENVVIAEHPLRSLPFFIRNPQQVPVVSPDEVLREASDNDYGVIFLYRELKDIVNSLAHFLHAGTRFVQFKTLADSFDVVVHRYAPVLARAIRVWKSEFGGMQISYERLFAETKPVLQEVCDEFELTFKTSQLINSPNDFRTFTFRKGGSGDWRNHLPPEHSRLLNQQYPDLVAID